MRIINPSCGLAPESSSGGEVHERELLLRLGKIADVHLLLSPVKSVPVGLRVHRENLWPPWGLRWWVNPFAVTPAILHCLHHHGRGVIRAHSLWYMGPAAILAGRLAGAPVLVHAHHLEEGRLAPLDGWVLRRADGVTTDSQFSARQIERTAGLQRGSVTVIPCGVGPEFLPNGNTRPGPLALFLGGLKPRKNVGFLIRAWRRVIRRVPEAQLLIAGDGPEFSRLATEASDLPSVIFRRRFTDSIKVDLYRLARVFCFPSRLEGFGMPPLEAQASGTPAIVSQEGALPEVVRRGETGYVLPLTLPDWEGALVECLTNPTRAAEMGSRGVAWARDFTWERTASETLAVAKALLEKALPGPKTNARHLNGI